MTGRSGRSAVRVLALSAGLTAVAAGWSLPAPAWLRLLAGALTAGTAWSLLRVLLAAAAAVGAVLRGRPPRPVLVGGALLALLAAGVGGPGPVARAAGPGIDVAAALAVTPEPVLRSGQPGSLVDRTGLGYEGRAFVDAGRSGVSALTARAYVGIGHASDEAERVQLAVEEWIRLGGLEHAVVLVAAPTGSGWVDRGAVAAAERAAGGDLVTVVVQYADRPSALEHLLGGDRSARVTTELARGLRAVLDTRPAEQRPRLVLFGESLGAAAVEQAAATVDVDGCLAAGAPGGATTPGGATSSGGTAGCRAVHNADDPVSWWSPRLLLARPEELPWLPVVTFWQVTAELAVSLDQPPGHGHSYGDALAPAWAQLLGPGAG